MYNAKPYNVLQYIVTILIILQCNSVFIGMHNTVSFALSALSFCSLLLLSFITLLKFRMNEDYYRKLIITFIIFFMTVIIFVSIEYLFIYEYNALPVFLWLASVPIMLVFFSIGMIHKEVLISFFRKYVSVVFFLSLLSIIFLCLYNLGFPTNTSLSSGWTGQIDGYYYLFFIFQRGSIFGLRNSSIFTEPVVFGFILIVSLLIQFFILEKRIRDNPFKFLITYVAIITTNSSNAIIISIIVLVLYFFHKNNIVKNIVLVPVAILGYYIISLVYKAKQSVDLYSSYSIRFNDIYACFNAWRDGNLLFGNGFNNFNNIDKYVYSFRLFSGSIGLSSGFFWMLVSGGLFLMFFWLIPNVLVFFRSKKIFIVITMINFYSVYGIICQSYLFAMLFGLAWTLIIFKDYKG